LGGWGFAPPGVPQFRFRSIRQSQAERLLFLANAFGVAPPLAAFLMQN
jgi:hypothetical protein